MIRLAGMILYFTFVGLFALLAAFLTPPKHKGHH
jgi:hypothetical protein